MPLQYDPITSEIQYEGKVVGRYDCKDGTARVSLTLTYECAPEEWVVPLSWFAYGLAHLAKPKLQEPVVSLTIETDEAGIAEDCRAVRSRRSGVRLIAVLISILGTAVVLSQRYKSLYRREQNAEQSGFGAVRRRTTFSKGNLSIVELNLA